MTESPPLRRALRMMTGRPHLVWSALAGLATWLVLLLVPEARWSTRAVVAWDIGVAVFVGSMMVDMAGRTTDHIRARAARQDEGQGLILSLMLIACIASLASVGAEMGLAKDASGLEKGLRAALAGVTVAGTWFMMQLLFALHYAHKFYSRDRPGGLLFPGGEDPDYWDFLHFALVIGAAAQTADISFTSKPLRRLGALHTVIAFLFNTVVLALSINLLASLV